MYTFEAEGHDIEAAVEIARQQILPLERQMEGFRGLVVLTDSDTGKLVSITFWETEELLEASNESAATITRFAAATVQGKRRDLEQFEVIVLELA
jgi:heme-degrading monooxygenase HmoA